MPKKPTPTEALRQAIKLAGGTQQALADLLGCSRSYISLCLNPDRREQLAPRMALLIDRKLGVKKEHLCPEIYL